MCNTDLKFKKIELLSFLRCPLRRWRKGRRDLGKILSNAKKHTYKIDAPHFEKPFNSWWVFPRLRVFLENVRPFIPRQRFFVVVVVVVVVIFSGFFWLFLSGD